MATSLRAWLRRAPQPHSVRYTTEDGEERSLKLSESARNRWKDAADALDSLRAVRVECIAADGQVLRVQDLQPEGTEDAGPADTDEKQRRAVAREHAAMATILDRYADRLNEAFERGAESANMGQANLLDVVQLMTAQWSATMTSLHNVSMNLANAILKAGGGESVESDPNGAALQQMVGMAVAKMMGGGESPRQQQTNGKKG